MQTSSSTEHIQQLCFSRRYYRKRSSFTGKLNFTENEDMDSRGKQKGGAITSTLSVLTFRGKGVFSKNRAYGYGGAICSINTYLVTLSF